MNANISKSDFEIQCYNVNMWERKRRGHWFKRSMDSKNSLRHKRKYIEEYIKYSVQKND